MVQQTIDITGSCPELAHYRALRQIQITWLSLISGAIVALQWFLDNGRKIDKHVLSLKAIKSIKVVKRLTERSSSVLVPPWDFHTSVCLEPADRLRALYGFVNSHWSVNIGAEYEHGPVHNQSPGRKSIL
jgi:hypothetical protein